MKILLINKFHYYKGGSETYYFAQAEALRKKGHEVVFFAMKDERNIDCAQEKYFVPNIDYNKKLDIKSGIKMVSDFCYSKIAAEKIEELIRDEKPDVAHIGLIHRQITFSVVDVLKKYNIPIVMTMHDLIFACPNYTMLTHGKICQRCVGGGSINCVKNKCVKDSIFKSMLAAWEKKYLLRKKYYDYIDLYIAECEFYKRLLIRSGITNSRVIKMTNFLPVEQVYEFKDSYEEVVLYFGRFSTEKGIMTLLKAHKKLGCKYKVQLVGNGPIQSEIECFIQDNTITNIEVPGAIYGSEMERIIEKAKVIVVPSEWYENCPYALLQSIAKGKIVIASEIGGLPELINDSVTGFLFKPGDENDLADKIEKVMTMNKIDYDRMSRLIAVEAKTNHYWEPYIDNLIREYKSLLDMREKR